MNPEFVIQSEVRKRKTNTVYMESRKNSDELIAGKEWRCRCREQTCGRRGGGESKTNRESSTDICTILCVKQIANGKLLRNTGAQAGTL